MLRAALRRPECRLTVEGRDLGDERQLDLHEPRFTGAVSHNDIRSVFTERIAGLTTLIKVLKGIDLVDVGGNMQAGGVKRLSGGLIGRKD